MELSQRIQKEINEAFGKAQEQVKGLSGRMNNEELLNFYGLYKQSTIGDINTTKPGYFNVSKEDKKWNAWNDNKGMIEMAAKKKYVTLAKELVKKYK